MGFKETEGAQDCRFCGRPPTDVLEGNQAGLQSGYRVFCYYDGCSGPSERTLEKAIISWNMITTRGNDE